MQEIMILRNVDNGTRLKLFQVDDNTLAKLTRIRGNLYKDDPLLRPVAEMPTLIPVPEPEISPERQAWLDGAYARYLAEQAAKATPAAMPAQPKQMSFEERIRHDWKYSPAIRAEFVSFASYVAYQKAAEAGKVKCYGKA